MDCRSRCFVVPLTALLLMASPVWAQVAPSAIPPAEQVPSIESLPAGEAAPGGQTVPPSESVPAGGTVVAGPEGPSFYFEADWLWTSHAGIWSDTRNLIDGPDAAGFSDLPQATGDTGYRLQGGVCWNHWIFEGVYSHFGDWTSTFNRNVDGVAFNANAIGGTWAGKNYINANTYFTPIVNAANVTSPVNTAGDQSGLGPSTGFPTDAHPALMAYSHSQFYMTEANVKGADYVFPLMGRGLRLGLGYVNANFNNDAWAGLTGTFRATPNVSGGTTVSLPSSVLTAATGGDLTLYNGGGTGFTDGISNGGGGVPSQLFFTHRATTPQ